MSRREVYDLTRRLRAFLIYQSTSPQDTYTPARQSDLDSYEARSKEIQKRAVAKEFESFKKEQTTDRSVKRSEQLNETTREKPEAREETAKGENQLWKTMDVVKPRATFDNLGVTLEGETSVARMQSLRELLGECTRCDLCESRSNIVFGVGSTDARIMIVGEAPGFNEDKKAEPFVGKAGELLDKMIVAMGLTRDEIYIANVLKCRPPQNRDPAPGEVRKCSPFLKKQIEVVNPEVIIAMGKFASNTLAGTTGSLSQIRGRWTEFDGVPLMPTYHPAHLLRTESAKRAAWEDLQKVMARLS